MAKRRKSLDGYYDPAKVFQEGRWIDVPEAMIPPPPTDRRWYQRLIPRSIAKFDFTSILTQIILLEIIYVIASILYKYLKLTYVASKVFGGDLSYLANPDFALALQRGILSFPPSGLGLVVSFFGLFGTAQWQALPEDKRMQIAKGEPFPYGDMIFVDNFVTICALIPVAVIGFHALSYFSKKKKER